MKSINCYKLGGFAILILLAISLVGMLWLNSFKLFDDPQVLENFSLCDPENKFKFSKRFYAGNAVTNRSIDLSLSQCDGEGREIHVFTADSPSLAFSDINASWRDENELLVEYDEKLRIFLKEEKVRISGKDLRISYEPFRVLSKDEVRTYWSESNRPAEQDFQLALQNEEIRKMTAKLRAEGVDSLIIFERWFPGSASINIDSCSVSESGEGKVFWFKDGRYSARSIKGVCVFIDQTSMPETLFRFVVSNYEDIKNIPIIKRVYSATQKNGHIRISTSIANHEPRYNIFIMLGELAFNNTFNESDLYDSLSLFHKENMNSPVKRLYETEWKSIQ